MRLKRKNPDLKPLMTTTMMMKQPAQLTMCKMTLRVPMMNRSHQGTTKTMKCPTEETLQRSTLSKTKIDGQPGEKNGRVFLSHLESLTRTNRPEREL